MTILNRKQVPEMSPKARVEAHKPTHTHTHYSLGHSYSPEDFLDANTKHIYSMLGPGGSDPQHG